MRDQALTNRLIKVANEKFAGSGIHLDISEQLEFMYEKESLRILLKPTTCRRGQDLNHRPKCTVLENANPQIDCIACDGNFVDCQRKAELWKTKDIREIHCGKVQRVHHFGQYGVASILLTTE
ncbi:hypothetical protein AALO_G00003210 [Alosa alosa]|uniref:Uncharacterized protein n=1 Tax=Alosa alosa TaxID=278164 RepID=A0AAV6HDH8_9TELE|nr:hypothetical protein AALO_G00003210 [Alosa alosa]